MQNLKIKFFLSLLAGVVLCLGLSFNASVPAQKVKVAVNHEAAMQQPLYMEYKGVRLGMTAEEARAKLGTPALKDSEQDYYVFSENETAQIVYDTSQRVSTISVDYLGGIGAPDYKAVVGGELEQRANGSWYRMVRYEGLRLWVSYNRSSGSLATVTLTIQKF